MSESILVSHISEKSVSYIPMSLPEDAERWGKDACFKNLKVNVRFLLFLAESNCQPEKPYHTGAYMAAVLDTVTLPTRFVSPSTDLLLISLG
jgi:hypothetical protein